MNDLGDYLHHTCFSQLHLDMMVRKGRLLNKWSLGFSHVIKRTRRDRKMLFQEDVAAEIFTELK